MSLRPRLLDAYCCQGGASRGYSLAGFDVTGVDLEPQPRYPYRIHKGDAVEFIRRHGHEFDAIAASPPCQRYSVTQVLQDQEHPDLIAPTRLALLATGKPFVIENVSGARSELVDPILLCGQTFGLRTYRHRLFESNVLLQQPVHDEHSHPVVDMGRALKPTDFYHAVGNFTDVGLVRRDLAVHWMDRDGVRECVPPAYTKYLGDQLIRSL